MKKVVEAKIIEKGESKTILEIEKQKLVLKSDDLPEESAKGEKLKAYFISPEEGVSSEKKLAKTILEEILNGK